MEMSGWQKVAALVIALLLLAILGKFMYDNLRASGTGVVGQFFKTIGGN